MMTCYEIYILNLNLIFNSFKILSSVLQTALEKQYREESATVQSLLRWLSETEHAMGSAQPESEQVQPLSEQLNKMKVRKREGWKVYGVVDEFM